MRKLLLAVLICTCSAAVRAEDFTGRVGLGLSGGTDLSFKGNSDSDLSWGFWAKRGLNARWAVGFSYENLHFNGSELRVQPQLVNVLYQLDPKSVWNPNLHAGVGLATVSDSGNRAALGLNAGIAFEIVNTDNTTWGLSADYYWAGGKTGGTADAYQLAGLSLKIGFWPVAIPLIEHEQAAAKTVEAKVEAPAAVQTVPVVKP